MSTVRSLCAYGGCSAEGGERVFLRSVRRMRTFVLTTHQFAPKMSEMDAQEWRDKVGAALRRARGQVSKREAARRAGFSEALWRQLETGEKSVAAGVVIPVSPRDETLEAAARAVGLDPADLFRLAGRKYHGPIVPVVEGMSVEDRLAAIERRLAEQDQRNDRIEQLLAELREQSSEDGSDDPKVIAEKFAGMQNKRYSDAIGKVTKRPSRRRPAEGPESQAQ